VSVEEVRSRAGFAGELKEVKCRAATTKRSPSCILNKALAGTRAYPLGIVTKIAAPASLRILIDGSGGHAGGVLMPDRHDALCAAAELILAIEGAARTSGAIDTVATVGICEVFPGAVNSIPSQVRLSVDIRDTDLRRRDAVLQASETAGRSISAKRQFQAHRVIERRCSGGLCPDRNRCAFSILQEARADVSLHGQPRLS